MPDAILKGVKKYIGDADILEDAAPEDEKPAVDQYYMILKREDRLEALRRVIDQAEDFYGLIFCARKVEADELARRLVEGSYPAEAIHGDLSQEARERTLRRFRSKLTTILVATDVAARGLDIERLTHVINWDMPGDRDTYVHRIGRTGRAGRRGRAISLILPSERGRMTQLSRSMERVLGSPIQFIKVPSVKKVITALKSRIVFTLCNIAAENAESSDAEIPETAVEAANEAPAETGSAEAVKNEDPESVLAALGRELIEKLGAEEAVAALLSLHYGEHLDASRYGPVTDISDAPPQQARFGKPGGKIGLKPGAKTAGPYKHGGRRFQNPEVDLDGPERVYVGMGRKHGVNAKDVADLLMRAGGVPGRLVDAIELRDYCAFATLPREAARRACAFSRDGSGDPAIRFAVPKGSGH
jgi:ATP-dependent RNA helicase DeaD